MQKYRFPALALAAGLFLLNGLGCSVEEKAHWPPEITHSKIATTLGGWHSTTRGTIRLVFPWRDKWLVFRGDPKTYHFSGDGITWSATEAPQAGRSHLIKGDTIVTFYSVMVKPAPDWIFDKFICRGTVSDELIRWEEPVKLDTRLGYYPDIKQDDRGYYSFTGRAVITDEDGQVKGTEILWKRSSRPNDISEWEADRRCIRHIGDTRPPGPGGWTKVGSTAHEYLMLNGGKAYVFGMMTVDLAGRLYGNLYDGTSWGEDIELASGMCTWAGTDQRMCAVFDSLAKVIHLAYVDGEGGLWYRSAGTPYGAEDWSEPVRLQPFKTFTTVLSLDSSRKPAHVYCLFGKTLVQGKDKRRTFGELYLQRFDGRSWSQPVLVSEPGTRENWYPNMNEDLRYGLGILYLKGPGLDSEEDKPPMDIIFASTGGPKILR